MAGKNIDTIAYAHESHRLFNEKLAERHTPKPDDVLSPWIPAEKIPYLHHDFDASRTAHMQMQSEATEHDQRRQGEKGSRGSSMVEQDRPQPALRPDAKLRAEADREAFEGRWLTEQHSTAMQQANENQFQTERQHERSEHTFSRSGPSR